MFQNWHSSLLWETLIIWSMNFDHGLKIGTWIPHSQIKNFIYVYSICIYINKLNLIDLPHPSPHPYRGKNNKIYTSRPNLRTPILRPLYFLQFGWNGGIFLPTSSYKSWFPYTSGQSWSMFDVSGLNCPWHQRWYVSSKFIGMHPGPGQ